MLMTGVSYQHPVNGMGLCLSSTAILHTARGVQLWLQRSTHRGVLTRRPCSSSLAGRAALSSTENVLPRHGVLAWNLDRSVGKVPVGEPSLSGEPECLSLPGTI